MSATEQAQRVIFRCSTFKVEARDGELHLVSEVPLNVSLGLSFERLTAKQGLALYQGLAEWRRRERRASG